jgi:hypothetical protein
MENSPYVVFNISGGIGKNIMATAVITSMQAAYPNHRIVVVATAPEVFVNNPNVYRVYRSGNTPYFMEDFIKDDTEVFQMEPYHHNSFIHKENI